MSKQDDKYSISLAGEFMVAGELYRRGIKAAVTYGNAKKADVVAYAGDKALVIEVKSTSKPQWVIGGAVPSASENVMWVLVFLPPDLTLPPEFFVLTQVELRKLVMPQEEDYRDRYRKKHGTEWAGGGVVSLKRSDALVEHRGAWSKIARQLPDTSDASLAATA